MFTPNTVGLINTKTVTSTTFDPSTYWYKYTVTEPIPESNQTVVASKGFPHYNILKKKDGSECIINIAVSGFSLDDLEVTTKDRVLTVRGTKADQKVDADWDYLEKGIATRSFERRWSYGEYVELDSVSLKNGILSLHLKLNVPEEKKPKKHTIATE